MTLFKFLKNTKYVFLSLFLVAGGCADLAVPNENSPTAEQVLATPADIESLVQSSYVTWWQATTDEMVMGVRVGADVYTASYGNFDMLNRGTVPRIPYDNTPTANGDTKLLTERIWYGMYGVLADANDFLTNLNNTDLVIPSREDGVSDEDYTAMIEANAYLQQGLAFMEIGLYYDKGFIFDHTSTEEEVLNMEFSTYQDMLAAADAKFAKAAEIASGLAGVTLGDGYISGYDDMSMSTEFVQLINTLRARTLVLGARTPEETQNIDWEAVKNFAANGIESDFSPEGDNNFWYDYTKMYGNLGWTRVDQRIISLMDPSQPSSYPTDGSNLGEASSDDQRLGTDFPYNATIPFDPSRGRYFFSEYQMAPATNSEGVVTQMSRYGYHTFQTATGAMPRYLKAENDLMYAEAVARTNDAANYATAADLVNITRVDRGGLEPLTAADFGTGAALDAILYEREVELFHTGFMQGLGDQRRLGKLMEGSILHYPVPAKELGILQEELYTFGGVGNDNSGTAKVKNNPFEQKFPVKSMREVRVETRK